MLDRFVSAGWRKTFDSTRLYSAFNPQSWSDCGDYRNHAALYRRDTGVDGLYLGFPFVVMRSATTTRPKIIPLLLWPARLNLEVGSRSNVAFSFRTSNALKYASTRRSTAYSVKTRRSG